MYLTSLADTTIFEWTYSPRIVGTNVLSGNDSGALWIRYSDAFSGSFGSCEEVQQHILTCSSAVGAGYPDHLCHVERMAASASLN